MIQAVFRSRSLLALRSVGRHTKFNSRSARVYSFCLGVILSFANYPLNAQVVDVTVIDQKIKTQPLTLSGISGGKSKAIEITQTQNTPTGFCDGYVNPQPNHLLQLESFFEFLRLEVQSNADTTVLVTGSGGVWCNDDAATANPIIEGQWQSGLYKVWVGSYEANTQNSYQIKITGR